MRLTEFGNDRGHPTIEDVKNNHPEIYSFMDKMIGYMALEQQTVVEMFNSAGSHHVILSIKPALGLNSTEHKLQQEKVEYERTKMAGGDIITGTLPFANFRIKNDNRSGNSTEQWNFEISQ